MPPARLGSEKADRVIGDRWTEEGLTAIPFKARPYGVEFVDADGVAQARNSMHFGGAMFFTDYSMSAMELTRALEERGFESIWAPEHSGSVSSYPSRASCGSSRLPPVPFVLNRPPIIRGTDSSNPSPSTSERGANLTRSADRRGSSWHRPARFRSTGTAREALRGVRHRRLHTQDEIGGVPLAGHLEPPARKPRPRLWPSSGGLR
jgi:hypothetical protein